MSKATEQIQSAYEVCMIWPKVELELSLFFFTKKCILLTIAPLLKECCFFTILDWRVYSVYFFMWIHIHKYFNCKLYNIKQFCDWEHIVGQWQNLIIFPSCSLALCACLVHLFFCLMHSGLWSGSGLHGFCLVMIKYELSPWLRWLWGKAGRRGKYGHRELNILALTSLI